MKIGLNQNLNAFRLSWKGWCKMKNKTQIKIGGKIYIIKLIDGKWEVKEKYKRQLLTSRTSRDEAVKWVEVWGW